MKLNTVLGGRALSSRRQAIARSLSASGSARVRGWTWLGRVTAALVLAFSVLAGGRANAQFLDCATTPTATCTGGNTVNTSHLDCFGCQGCAPCPVANCNTCAPCPSCAIPCPLGTQNATWNSEPVGSNPATACRLRIPKYKAAPGVCASLIQADVRMVNRGKTFGVLENRDDKPQSFTLDVTIQFQAAAVGIPGLTFQNPLPISIPFSLPAFDQPTGSIPDFQGPSSSTYSSNEATIESCYRIQNIATLQQFFVDTTPLDPSDDFIEFSHSANASFQVIGPGGADVAVINTTLGDVVLEVVYKTCECAVDAVPDVTRVCVGSSVSIPVTANDTTTCGAIDPASLVLTPSAGFSKVGNNIVFNAAGVLPGTYVANYTVCNNQVPPCCDSGTLTVTVCETTANDDQARVCAGSQVTIPVLSNDSTTCGSINPASLVFVGTPPAGFSIVGGNVVYTNSGTPNCGTVTATYQVGNNLATPCFDTATVTVTICSVTAQPDTARVCAGSSVTIPVLANDTTCCGTLTPGSLTFVGTPPAGFSIVGSNVVYTNSGTPNCGTVTANYRVCNNEAIPCCGQSSVTVTICSVTAQPDTARVCAGSSVTIPVLANDTTCCGTLTPGSLTFVGTPPAGFSIVGSNVVYTNSGTPNCGTVTATYRVCNNEAIPCCGQASVTVTICSVTAQPDTARVCAGSSVTIPVLANDTTCCGTLTPGSLTFVGTPPAGFSIVGSNVVYTNSGTPNCGTVTANYRVCNNEAIPCCGESSVTVTICSVTALPDNARVCAGGSVSVPVLANDTTCCGTLTPGSLAFVGTPPAGFSIVGSNVVYTNPGTPTSGTVQATYRVCNNEAIPCCGQSTVTITICSTTAQPDTAQVCAGATVTIPVLANDSTVCGNLVPSTLSFVGTPPTGFSINGSNVVYNSALGPATGTFVATYRICNEEVRPCCAQTTVTVTVCNVNAVDDLAEICCGDSVTVNPLTNDTSTCGTLSCAQLQLLAPVPPGVTLNGCLVTYDSTLGPCPAVIQIPYRISAPGTLPCFDEAVIRITVKSNPNAADDSFSYGSNATGPVDIPVLENDSPGAGCAFIPCTGCDCNDLTPAPACGVCITKPPSHGTVTVNPDCTVRYTPNATFTDTDEFCYRLTNSCGCTDDACVQIVRCREINRNVCGSLLLYPEFDNRQASLTLFTLTNGCCDITSGNVLVEFRFIDKNTCLETNRTFTLTPCDTITFLTSAVNPNQMQGYAYAYAKRAGTTPENPDGEPIVFNRLIGQLLMINGIEALDYGLNAVSFLGLGQERADNDDDHDGIRDLNGPNQLLGEYEEAPDRILIPRFLGQDTPSTQPYTQSRIILINLSGGMAFTTTLSIRGFNDDESEFSDAYTFKCWDKPYLRDFAGFTAESFLDSVANDPAEIVGNTTRESGWLWIDGGTAASGLETIHDPAFYAVLIEQVGPHTVADLPFEFCSQANGDLLPLSPFGDGPIPVDGDDQ